MDETQDVVVRAAGAHLVFHRTAQGLDVRVLALAPTRLQINQRLVEGLVVVHITGRAGSAFWETVQPTGRPARSVEGLAFTYDARKRTLSLLVRSRRGTIVRLARREVARLELCLIGHAAGEIWASLQRSDW